MLNKNGERALAYIVKCGPVTDIEGADFIQLIQINGWRCIIKKGELHEGDRAVYFEIDSKVPETEWSEFLRPKKFKIKTYRLGKFGVISQGLAMPLSIDERLSDLPVGEDVTELLGVEKIEDATPIRSSVSKYEQLRCGHKKVANQKWFKFMMKFKWFRKIAFRLLLPKKSSEKFPTWYEGLTKSDEERCENIPWVLKNKEPFVVTTKIDGTSTTVIVDARKRKRKTIVCSRNIVQQRNSKNFHDNTSDDNVYWQVVDKYKLEDFLNHIIDELDLKWAAIQGETAGKSNGGKAIQGDPHKFGELRFFGFNLVIPVIGRVDTIRASKIAAEYNVPWVPIVDENYILPDTIEEFKKHAIGDCEAEGAKGMREGYVYRAVGNPMLSFKNINNEYLIKRGV